MEFIKIYIFKTDFIKSNGSVGNNDKRWAGILKCSNLFPEYGVKIVNKVSDCDIFIYTCPPNPRSKTLDLIKKPVILALKADAASISNKFMNNPKIIAIFKDFNMRNLEDNLLPQVQNRYHYHLILNAFKLNKKDYRNEKILRELYKKNGLKSKKPKTKKKFLYKLKTVPWNFHSFGIYTESKNSYINAYNVPKTKWDLFMVKHHRSSMCGYARKIALEKIIEIKGIKKCYKKLSSNEYFENFIRSKICVGCWGFGERIADDINALACGVILIKPNTDHVLTYPDIYQPNKYYIPCKHDYSDLEKVVKHVLDNYNFYKRFAERARKYLLDYTPRKIVKNFCENITLSFINKVTTKEKKMDKIEIGIQCGKNCEEYINESIKSAIMNAKKPDNLKFLLVVDSSKKKGIRFYQRENFELSNKSPDEILVTQKKYQSSMGISFDHCTRDVLYLFKTTKKFVLHFYAKASSDDAIYKNIRFYTGEKWIIIDKSLTQKEDKSKSNTVCGLTNDYQLFSCEFNLTSQDKIKSSRINLICHTKCKFSIKCPQIDVYNIKPYRKMSYKLGDVFNLKKIDIIKDVDHKIIKLETNLPYSSLAHSVILDKTISLMKEKYGMIINCDILFLKKNWDYDFINMLNETTIVLGTESNKWNQLRNSPSPYALFFDVEKFKELKISFKPGFTGHKDKFYQIKTKEDEKKYGRKMGAKFMLDTGYQLAKTLYEKDLKSLCLKPYNSKNNKKFLKRFLPDKSSGTEWRYRNHLYLVRLGRTSNTDLDLDPRGKEFKKLIKKWDTKK